MSQAKSLDAHARKQERLVDWQVDLLMQYLSKILIHRGNTKSTVDVSKLMAPQGAALDEVAEVIKLPQIAGVDAADVSLIESKVESQLRDFIQHICEMYRHNPFHSFEHASHVTQSATKLLSRIAIPEDVDLDDVADVHTYTYGITSDPLTQVAIILSALIHDVDHTGVPNGQLAQEDPELAARYQNKSVAEQNSVHLAWNLLMKPNYVDLQKCIYADETEFRRFRQLIVNSEMATDIFDPSMKKLRDARWEKAFSAESNVDATDLKATIVIEHVIQAADVAHTMQHWHIYQKWNARLFAEMYDAFRKGRSEKDPSLGWYRGELWFFDNYVIPLAKKLDSCKVFGVASDECLNYAIENRREWAMKGETVVTSMLDRCREA